MMGLTIKIRTDWVVLTFALNQICSINLFREPRSGKPEVV